MCGVLDIYKGDPHGTHYELNGLLPSSAKTPDMPTLVTQSLYISAAGTARIQ